MTEADTKIAGEVPLSPGELERGVKTSMGELLEFIQAHDGFAVSGRGEFDFFEYGCRYVGSYKSETYGHMGRNTENETIDITRSGGGILDHSVIVDHPRTNELLITYANLNTGHPTAPNTHGALRGTQEIIKSPMLQFPGA